MDSNTIKTFVGFVFVVVIAFFITFVLCQFYIVFWIGLIWCQSHFYVLIDLMERGLVIPTGREDIVLRQLSTQSDDLAYFNALNGSREYLDQNGEKTGEKYPSLMSVAEARINPVNADKLRFGIWGNNQQSFLGSINLTPKDDCTEIGYWLDQFHTGHGYATFALKALSAYALEQGYPKIYAEVTETNQPSLDVLERAGYAKVCQYMGSYVLSLLANAEKPQHIIAGNETLDISFIETQIVADGVTCDSYAIKDDDSRDFAIIKVDKKCRTPVQKVIKGKKTIEGFLAGTGNLVTYSRNKRRQSIYTYGGADGCEPVRVKVGEKMQWVAGDTDDLYFFEICQPPFKQGRFKNVTNQHTL